MRLIVVLAEDDVHQGCNISNGNGIVEVDIAKNELKDDVSLKKGDKITIYRTNGKDTVIFKTSDGSYVGLKYEKSFEFNGKPTEETFDGAVFAG